MKFIFTKPEKSPELKIHLKQLQRLLPIASSYKIKALSNLIAAIESYQLLLSGMSPSQLKNFVTIQQIYVKST